MPYVRNGVDLVRQDGDVILGRLEQILILLEELLFALQLAKITFAVVDLLFKSLRIQAMPLARFMRDNNEHTGCLFRVCNVFADAHDDTPIKGALAVEETLEIHFRSYRWINAYCSQKTKYWTHSDCGGKTRGSSSSRNFGPGEPHSLCLT